MTAGQAFVLLVVFLFCFAAYSTARQGMTPYYAIMTVVLWLGIGVGWLAKIAIEVWK